MITKHTDSDSRQLAESLLFLSAFSYPQKGRPLAPRERAGVGAEREIAGVVGAVLWQWAVVWDRLIAVLSVLLPSSQRDRWYGSGRSYCVHSVGEEPLAGLTLARELLTGEGSAF